MKFKAVRSAVNKALAGPSKMASWLPALIASPSFTSHVITTLVIDLSKGFCGIRQASNNHGLAGHQYSTASLRCRDEISGDITGSNIFLQGSADIGR